MNRWAGDRDKPKRPPKRPFVSSVAFEIKPSITPKLDRRFHLACEDLAPEKRWVAYGGMDSFHIADQVEALSLVDLCGRLSALRA